MKTLTAFLCLVLLVSEPLALVAQCPPGGCPRQSRQTRANTRVLAAYRAPVVQAGYSYVRPMQYQSAPAVQVNVGQVSSSAYGARRVAPVRNFFQRRAEVRASRGYGSSGSQVQSYGSSGSQLQSYGSSGSQSYGSSGSQAVPSFGSSGSQVVPPVPLVQSEPAPCMCGPDCKCVDCKCKTQVAGLFPGSGPTQKTLLVSTAPVKPIKSAVQIPAPVTRTVYRLPPAPPQRLSTPQVYNTATFHSNGSGISLADHLRMTHGINSYGLSVSQQEAAHRRAHGWR